MTSRRDLEELRDNDNDDMMLEKDTSLEPPEPPSLSSPEEGDGNPYPTDDEPHS